MSAVSNPTAVETNAMRADELLIETIEGLLGDHCTPERIGAAEGGADAALWSLLEDSGLTLVGVSETRGGSGGSLHDSAAIVKAAGRHAAPVPLADTLVAASLAAAGGLDVPVGPLALAVDRPGLDVIRVPWGGGASNIVVVNDGGVALVPTASLPTVGAGCNYPGEPWVDLAASTVRSVETAVADGTPAGAFATAALYRALLASGALSRAVDLSVQYCNEREQFGKPIGKFQILQHYLAEMAGEAVAAEAAVDNAVDVIANGADEAECILVCAAAKAYAGRAVATINRLAHQIHGAIGYTDEHRLQYTTRRLWAWRDEFGSEAEWAAVVGRGIAAGGGAAMWPRITQWPPVRA